MIRFLKGWLRRRVRALFRESDVETELSDELQLHLEMEAKDLIAQGWNASDASREARLRMGGVEQTKESVREVRPLAWMGGLGLDLKLGLRLMRKHWGVTLMGGLSMAMAMIIGAVLFSFIHTILGTSVPLEDGERVVIVQPVEAQTRHAETTAYADFERWREIGSLTDVGAFQTGSRELVTDGDSQPVTVAEMSTSGFRLARVAPLMGRFLLPEDEASGADPVVVIGYRAWQSRFAGAPDIVGRRVQLDGVFHTIAGVMPEEFTFPVDHQYWVPLKANPEKRVIVFARLADGVSMEQANAEVKSLALLDSDIRSGNLGPMEARVVPYVIGFSGEAPALLAWLPWLLPLVLIPPCANMAILIYARTVSRQGEFAARTTLGARRGRIVGQIFLEVLLLAGLAAAIALMVSPRLVLFLVPQAGEGQPFWRDFGISYATIGFVCGLTLIAALIAGAIPALRVTGRWQLQGLTALGGRSAPRLGKVWTTLVLLQVAMSIALIPAGTEIAWTLSRPSQVGPRMDGSKYLTATLIEDHQVVVDRDSPEEEYVVDEIVRQLEAEPGVSAVAVAATAPYQERYVQFQMQAPDGSSVSNPDTTSTNRVDRDFFDVFGVRVLLGRTFQVEDLEPDSNVIVINRSFARRLIGEAGNPLGWKIRTVPEDAERSDETNAGPWLTIIGVVEDFSSESGLWTFYQPLERSWYSQRALRERPLSIVVHTEPEIPKDLPVRMVEIVESVDGRLRVGRVRSMKDIWDGFWRTDYYNAWGVGALILGEFMFSIAGLYTLMVFTVVQRRREIGIRAALGAPLSRLVGGIFRQVFVPLAIGVALGGLAATLIEFYLSPILFEFRENGRTLPWILPAAESVILLIGTLSMISPVRRALSIDPVDTIRDE